MPGRVLSSESEGSGSGSAVSNTQPTTAAKKMAKNKVRKAVKISKSQKVSNVSEVKNNGRRVTTRAQSSAESQVNLLPGIDDVVLPNKTPKLPKKKISRDESVTKVKLLTGTLYIYRGKTRRAEFVRTKWSGHLHSSSIRPGDVLF